MQTKQVGTAEWICARNNTFIKIHGIALRVSFHSVSRFFSLHFFRIAVFSVCRLCDCGAIEVIGEKKLCIRLLWAPPIGSRFVRVHPICVFLPWRFEDICEKHSKQFETIWLFFFWLHNGIERNLLALVSWSIAFVICGRRRRFAFNRISWFC